MKTPESRSDILIKECLEPLLEIPNDGRFVFMDPHPYEVLGAPYRGNSPFRLRKRVLSSLIQASELLEKKYSGYKLKIHDAYRPLAVQEFMVKHVAEEFCQKVYNILLTEANEQMRQEAFDHTFKLFAKPDTSIQSPPPHSTGAALDVTMVDALGQELPMGSEIDAVDNAHPDAFKHSQDPQGIIFHKNRMFLKHIMEQSGFIQLPREWWHFSQGDQTAVFLQTKTNLTTPVLVAKYGRIDL